MGQQKDGSSLELGEIMKTTMWMLGTVRSTCFFAACLAGKYTSATSVRTLYLGDILGIIKFKIELIKYGNSCTDRHLVLLHKKWDVLVAKTDLTCLLVNKNTSLIFYLDTVVADIAISF